MRLLRNLLLLAMMIVSIRVWAQAPNDVPPILHGHDGYSPVTMLSYWQNPNAGIGLELEAETEEEWEGPPFQGTFNRGLTIKRWILQDEIWAKNWVTHPKMTGSMPFPGFDSIVANASYASYAGISARTAVFVKGRTVVKMQVNAEGVPSDYFTKLTELLAADIEGGPVPPDPPSGPVTLTASKDALIYEKSPHSNEGANPRLTLEKITGKAARNLLGFDLTGIDTDAVTRATLVLTIDPSSQVTGWGNGETVSVKPVTIAWAEGNGKMHSLPGHQQTAGSGAGTTWFSPTDENISNSSANAAVQWGGAATYATTGTAPPLTVHNHQTGELRFDVTQDVRNGVAQGWLLRKDAENKGSKVSFYSREGSATLGPRLILEYD